jgi:hypothetical protein
MFALILAAAAVCPPHLSQIILVSVLHPRDLPPPVMDVQTISSISPNHLCISVIVHETVTYEYTVCV